MTDFDPTPYAEGIRELNRREAERIEARLARARDEAERLAKRIAEADDRVARVILFGSVATGRPSREDFDIDLAVDGGDPDLATDQIRKAEFEVDIVALGRLPEGMRRMVEDRGEILFPPRQ